MRWILIVAAVVANLKCIFTNFNMDAEYAVLLSYRLARGDRMFLEMWEPHQTSAFVGALFTWLYLAVTGTTTGIVLYLNACGLVCKAAVTAVLYKILKRNADEDGVFLLCLFFFTVNPKDTLLPEFSNLQLWFSALLFACLIRYLQRQSEKRWLLATGGFLCLEILAYPSCLLVFPAVIGILLLYSEQKARDTLLLTGECVLLGSAYCGWFVGRMGFENFVRNVGIMLAGDSSHSDSLAVKLRNLAAFSAQAVGIVLAVAAVSAIGAGLISLIRLLLRRWDRSQLRHQYLRLFFSLYAGFGLLYTLVYVLSTREGYDYYALYLPLVAAGCCARTFCSPQTRRIHTVGLAISGMSFAATMALTNLTVVITLAYAALAVGGSLLTLAEAAKSRAESGDGKKDSRAVTTFLTLFCALAVFRCGYLNRSMCYELTNVFQIRNVVKSGPALGIFSDYIGPHMMNTDRAEWADHVQAGDRLLIVGIGAGHTSGYLYEDVEICTDSTISTPTYDEKLLTYWEQNPQKMPNVVAVSCTYGNSSFPEDSWIMRWLEEEFCADEISDGTYHRFYRKR